MTNNDLLFSLSGEDGVQSLRRAYYELGRSMIALGKWNDAVVHLNSALNTPDTTVDEWKIYALLAYAYRQIADATASDRYLLQAIATSPADISAKLVEAAPVANFSGTGTGNDGFDSLLIQIGEAELDRRHKRLDDARYKLENALKIAAQRNEPEREYAIRLALANILYDAGDFLGAQEQIKLLANQAARTGKATIDAVVVYGKCSLALKQYEEPLKIAEEWIKAKNELAAHILKLQTYLYQADYKNALDAVHSGFIAHPASDELEFYKMQILIESNYNPDDAIAIFQLLKTKAGIDFIISKLEDGYLRYRSHHGNDNYFIAQLYDWMPERFTKQQVLDEADKAIREKVSLRSIDYPHGLAYRLKAEVCERMGETRSAAEFYSNAGKEFYWSRQYNTAETLFAKAIALNESHIEAYRYYADNQMLLTFSQEFPYVDSKMLDRAFALWQTGYNKQAPTLQDGWSYLTLARLYEQQSCLPEADRQKISLSAWLAVEKNLLLTGPGFYALTFISRILRDMDGMENFSYNAAKKAEELKGDNDQVWESLTAIAFNLGYWDEGMKMLKKLRDANPASPAFIGWEAFAVISQRTFEEGLQLTNDTLEKDPTWSWARQLRMFCYWILDRKEEAQPDVEYLLSRESFYLTHRVYWDIAFAYFMNGQPDKAHAICSSVPNTNEFEKYKYMYQSMYSASMGKMREAETELDQFLALCRVERDVVEHRHVMQKVGNGTILFADKFETRLRQVRGYWSHITPVKELEALQKTREEYRDEMSDGWLVWHLAYFRMMLDECEWTKAVHEATLVNEKRKDYPDAHLMYDRLLQALQIWLLNKMKHGDPFDQWKRLQDSLEYLDQPFISLPDSWYMASLLAQHRNEPAIAADFLKRAHSLYAQLHEEDMEKNIRRLREQYPEIDQYLSKEDSASVQSISVCKVCGSVITSPDQRFCYNCGDSLYSSTGSVAVSK